MILHIVSLSDLELIFIICHCKHTRWCGHHLVLNVVEFIIWNLYICCCSGLICYKSTTFACFIILSLLPWLYSFAGRVNFTALAVFLTSVGYYKSVLLGQAFCSEFNDWCSCHREFEKAHKVIHYIPWIKISDMFKWENWWKLYHSFYHSAYLDCHLMVTNPMDYVEQMAKAGASGFTFHIEVAQGIL